MLKTFIAILKFSGRISLYTRTRAADANDGPIDFDTIFGYVPPLYMPLVL
jgi:hypothetical protein